MAESSGRKIPTHRCTTPHSNNPSPRMALIEGGILEEERRDEFIQI